MSGQKRCLQLFAVICKIFAKYALILFCIVNMGILFYDYVDIYQKRLYCQYNFNIFCHFFISELTSFSPQKKTGKNSFVKNVLFPLRCHIRKAHSSRVVNIRNFNLMQSQFSMWVFFLILLANSSFFKFKIHHPHCRSLHGYQVCVFNDNAKTQFC